MSPSAIRLAIQLTVTAVVALSAGFYLGQKNKPKTVAKKSDKADKGNKSEAA